MGPLLEMANIIWDETFASWVSVTSSSSAALHQQLHGTIRRDGLSRNCNGTSTFLLALGYLYFGWVRTGREEYFGFR